MNTHRVLIPTQASRNLPGLLELASGTYFRVTVRDCRELGPWGTLGAFPIEVDRRMIVYHHTGLDAPPGHGWQTHRPYFEQWRREWDGGLPWHFLVMPHQPYRIYYMHDITTSLKNTPGYPEATHIAAVGDFNRIEPEPGMVKRMLRLADAITTEWGEFPLEIQHRETEGESCPGEKLSPHLPSRWAQRD